MKLVEYHFPHMISASFEIPSDEARRLMPRGIEPVEAWHGSSVLTVTLFEFDRSPIGPYQEVVLSIFAVPRLIKGDLYPHAAVTPIRLGSTHHQARQHAIELWHLPHFMEDIRIDFTESADRTRMTGKVFCPRGEEILELNVSHQAGWHPVTHQYQSFQVDSTGLYMGKIDWIGKLSEHEEGTGSIRFRNHRFFEGLIEPGAFADSPPMREMWMRDGVEAYYPITQFSPAERNPV